MGRLTKCSGEFEGHITVGLASADEPTRLRAWATEHGLKCVHILLECGVHSSQPMLSWRGSGTLSEQLGIGKAHSAALQEASFEVVRLKLEADSKNRGTPQSNEEARCGDPSRYFEHHVKISQDPNADLTRLRQEVGNLGARLSRNAFQIRSDGVEERFVTQRCYGIGRPDAKARLEVLVQVIAGLGFPILDVEEEFVVWDSDVGLDAGWIDEG